MSEMKRGDQIGFTGTQTGMTKRQKAMVSSLLDVLCPNGGHVHHGDCVGADEQFHAFASERDLRIEIHPPCVPSKRAFCKGDTLWPEYDYLKRNQHIVDCVQVLIATPNGYKETTRSGTWFTVRRARVKGIRILIVEPDGTLREE
jgi:hypothetical protein